MADGKSVSTTNPATAVNTPPIPTKDTRNEKMLRLDLYQEVSNNER